MPIWTHKRDYSRTSACGFKLAASLTALLAASPALAGGVVPTGGQVTAGQATIGTAPGGLIINQATGHAIINWQDFSIGAGNAVKFNNGSGATLNRVTGGNLSQIDGVLKATGSLYLINPQGVVVGAGGKVITGGSFVASTRDVNDDAFMRGDPLHAQGSSSGNVVNQGKIVSRYGDTILIGKNVSNSGTIKAPRGTAALAAGDDVTLRPMGGDARISISAGKGDVTNTGTVAAAQAELNAAGGNVYAVAGNQGGLSATGTATINGRVWLTSGGTTEISGKVSAVNKDGSGGTIIATAPTVTVDAGARITASGTKGGTVLLGGDEAGGSDPARKHVAAPVATAKTTTVAEGAQISADGSAGAGGQVVVWSDLYTLYNGAISARGAGAASGGNAEVSSHGVLDFEGAVDLLSDRGATGMLLLDPNNLTISTGTTANAGSAPNYVAGATNSVLKNSDLTTALNSANITVTASGNITVSATIASGASAWTGANGLTLNATGTLTISSAITNTHGATLTLKSGGSISGNGAISVGSLEILPTASTVQAVSLTGSNSVGTLAANVASLNFKNGKALVIGTAGSTTGITATGALTLNNGSFAITDTAAPVTVGSFTLTNGTWSQNQASLPTFTTATSFTINGGSFLRVTGGDGSSATPYQIADVYGLQGVGTASANYALASDINASGTSSWNNGKGFATLYLNGGFVFDGQNHTVSGLTINDTSGFEVGLFRDNYGTIQNLTLSGGSVTSAGPYYLGGVAGQNFGTISNVTSGASVTGTNGANLVGGLVGFNNGSITNSHSSGTVTADGGAIGGLVGQNYATVGQSGTGVISNSSATGNVVGANGSLGTYTYGAGGLVGSNSGSIDASFATGNVTGYTQLGGLVGINTAQITGSHATGTVTAPFIAGESSDAGGLVGQNFGTIDTSYASGNVVGDLAGCCGSNSDFGGLVGLNLGAITNSHASGNVTGLTSVGGLVGVNGGYNNGTPQGGTIDNSYYELGTVTGVGDTGGLVGSNGVNGLTLASTVTNSHTASTATINGTRSAGGLVGGNYGGTTVADSFSDAAVNGVLSPSDQIYGVGGFVGANNGTIRNSHATGAVTSVNDSYYVGGFAGTASGTTTNSYATGNVVAGNYVGGFAGDITGNTSDSYAAGDVTVYGGNGGGFAGIAEGTLSNDHATGTVRAGDASQSSSGFYAAGGIGGFAGSISAGTVSNSYATGDVLGFDGSDNVNYSSSVGGFAASNGGTILQSHATGKVTGFTTVGGLVGVNYGSISGSYATGKVTSGLWYGEPVAAGGLVGENDGAITTSYASGNVSSPNNDPNGYYDFGVGGLVGANGGNHGGTIYTGTIASSYATGTVSGTLAVGGLVGSTTGGSITDSYATGNVSGWSMVGGLVGENELGSITNTYATGSVSGGGEMGGLVGSNGEYGDFPPAYGPGTIATSYWNTDVNPGLPGLGWDSGSSTSVTGLTTAQMQDGAHQATNFAGFDFTNTWSPASAGFAPQLYGVSYVVKVIAGGGTAQYGDAIASSINFHSLQNGDLTSSITGFSVTGVSQGDSVGTYAVTATGASLTSSSGVAYRFVYQNGNFTITPRQLTLSLTGTVSKAYDGTTAATLTTANYGALGNIYNGDDVSLASMLTSANYSDKNAGSGKTVTVSGLQLAGAAANNYTLGSASGNIGTISKAVLTDSLIGTVSKTYDGTTAATLTAGNFGTLGGIIGSDTVALDITSATATYANANAGSGKTVNLSGAQLTGADALNYTIGTISGIGIGNIDKATISAALNSASCICKIYNGNTNANVVVNDLLVSGLTGMDDAALNVTGATYASKNVSSNLGLTINLSLTGTSAGNYILNTPTVLATGGQIAVKTISLSNTLTGTVTKVYDATTAATLTQSNYNTNGTIVSGDDVTINGTGAFATAPAGTSIKVTASGLTLSGADKDNYVLSRATVTGTNTIGTITKATLTYTANSASRLYGASNPTFGGTVTGFVGGQTQANATTGTLAFTTTATSSSNAGNYAVNGSGLSATNYAFVQAAGNTTALTVNPATLTYTATAANRLYGAANPGFTGTVTGFVLSQTQATATTGTLAFTTTATQSSDVGNYAINGGGLTANNGNYVFVQAAANATRFTINPATLTYTTNAANKIYGDLNPSFGGSVTGFVLGQDQAAATTGTLAFTTTAAQSSNVGNYAVNGSGLTANNGNYVFAQAAGNATALIINPASLTYTATSASRLYGSANPGFTGTVTGFVLGQSQATATTGTATFNTTATSSSNVGDYAINGSGLTANNGNYVFTQAAGNATALTINPATLIYTATAANRLYGDANPGFTGTVAGFVLGQSLATATSGTAVFNTAATASSNVGNYAVNGSGLTANNGNYVFAQAAGNAAALTINPATLTYAADAASRLYGASDPAFTGTVTGFVLGQSAGTATTGTVAFTTTATSSSNVGSYAVNGSGLTANNGNYVFVQAAGNAAALTINPATLTYTADAVSRLYGASDPAFTGTVTGFVLGQSVAAATSGTAAFNTTATSSSNVGSYAVNGSGLTATNGNYVFVQAAGNAAALTINPATLTYTADAASRLYGASDPAFTGTVSGFVLGQSAATATTGTAAFNTTATSSSNVGSYAINGSGLTANNGNYVFVQSAGNAAALAINPATLTYTSDAASRLYGASDPAFTGTVTGFVLGQSAATATTGTAAFNTTATASSNVGNYAVNGSGLTANNGNYVFVQSAGNAAALTINPATLTYTADAASRLYGASDPAFTGAVSGFVLGQNLATATAGTTAFTTTATSGSNVGSYAVNGSGLTANNGNYVFVQAAGNATALAINPATLTYTSDAASRLYGAADPAFTGAVSGFVLGQSSATATTGTAAFSTTATSSSNVGNYAINGSGLTANNGNYVFVQAAGNATALTINPASLTYTADAASRLYGASDPTFTGTVTGFVLGQSAATATGGTAVFTTTATSGSNVGNYAVNGSGLTANNANYVFVQAAGNAAALTINPATLTYAADAASRLYGGTDPAFTGTVSGFVLGQSAATATTGTAAFNTTATASSNVGSYAVNGSGLTANNGNYVFVQAAGNATALAINPASLTYTADAVSRGYGASDPAFTGTVTGFVLGQDQASVTTGTLVFTTAATSSDNVGNYAVNGSGLTANNGNYVFAQAVGNATALTINPATLTYTADAATRLYGDANPGFTGTVTGFVLGQSAATATSGTAAFNAAATASSNVGSYAVNGSGLTANSGNYVFAQAAGNAAALTINPATLTYTADAAGRTYGDANPTFTGTVTGFVLGQSTATATSGTAVFNTPATSSDNVGSYAVNGSGLTANNGNYVFVQAAGNAAALTINPMALTVTAGSGQSKLYGDADPASFGYAVTTGHLVGSDALTGSLARAAGENAGAYAINQGSLGASANYTLSFSGANFSINQRPITVAALAGTKVYGTVDPALAYALTSGNLVNGDGLSGALARAAGENVGNYAIAQGSVTAGGNYLLTFVPGSLVITPAALAITAGNLAKTYGDTANLSGDSFTASGLVSGDRVSSVAFASTGAPGTANVGGYAIIASGAAGTGLGNYTIAYNPGTLTVGARAITVTAANASRVYGSANPVLTATASGLVNGDSLSGAPITAASAASHAGIYAITQGSLAASSNYVLSFVNGALTITPAGLTITANDITAQNVSLARPTARFSGLVNGDSSAAASGLQFGLFPVTGTSYDVVPFGATAADYTIVYVPGILSITADQPSPIALAIPPQTGTASGSLTIGGQTFSFSNVATSAISGSSPGGPGVALFQVGLPGQLSGFTTLVISDYSNATGESDRLATE